MPTMITESAELTVKPRIVPEGWNGTVRIGGEYEHTRFVPGAEYRFELHSMFFYAVGDRQKRVMSGTARADADGSLLVPFTPDICGEWILSVESDEDKRKNRPLKAALYVLSGELYRYRPHIGDFHSHSTSSDGAQEPAYPPMRARTFGCDFFALTDHWCYAASEVMKKRVGQMLGSRMVLFNGEEMHPEPELLREPDRPDAHFHHYHYVAVGHSASVRDAFRADPETSAQEVLRIADEIKSRGLDPRVDPLPYAEGVWKLRKAKELGGLTIYCHPYWAHPVNMDAGALEQSFAHREADAVEALSRADDTPYMANRLLSLAADPAAASFPVVGVSDSHDWQETEPFSCCTFVMTEKLEQESILDAVRAGRSVACRMSDPPELVGPFELIGFAWYYLHRILPIRRRITALQGSLALSALRGGPFSQQLIDDLDTELVELDRSMWA